MKTVAIVGSHTITREFAPWSRTYKDFWLFNEAAATPWAKRVDAVFQMHQPEVFKSSKNQNDPKHWEWLQQEYSYPIYMQEAYSGVPSAVKYPLDEVCDELLPKLRRKGTGRKEEAIRFFTSSVDYAIALALYQGYERIELYGVEMATDTEYKAQREGLGLWLGIAVGRGVEVILLDVSIILNALVYGYDGGIEVHRQAFETQKSRLSEEIEKRQAVMDQSGGMVQSALENMMKADSAKLKERFAQEYLERLQKHQHSIMAYGVISGALQENERYLDIVDAKIDAAGGQKALKAMENGTGELVEA